VAVEPTSLRLSLSSASLKRLCGELFNTCTAQV
jgi:hypothetical protein